MPAPGNYDSYTMVIKVDPTTMFSHATVDIPASATTISDSLGRIADVWENLSVGWVGTTADEAQDFNDRWNAAITGLYGTDDDDSSGAIEKIASAVGLAAINYGEAEDTNLKNFAGLLNGPSSDAPLRNQGNPPVTETNHPS